MKTEKQSPAKRPIKVAGYSHAKADALKTEKRKAAEWRQAQYDKLSAADREALDARRKDEYSKTVDAAREACFAGGVLEREPRN